MSDSEQMKVLADQLFLYMKPKIQQMMNSTVSFFRAEVVSNPGDNTLTIRKPMENGTMTLPCSNSVASAEAGDQVVVLVMGSMSNAVVVSDGMMKSL